MPSAHESIPIEASNAGCGRCHARVLAEWSRSAHRRGLENPRFVAEWSREPLRFCSDCHAPLGAPGSEGAHEAIGCAACHVRGGVVVAYREPASATARATTRSRTDPNETLCAPCHDFAFPDTGEAPRSDFVPGQPLQSTFREWRSSTARAAGLSCIDCHMRSAAGGHAMAVGTPAEGPVLAVSVRFVADGVLELRLETTARVGHALPTGDVFRQLIVEVRELDGTLVARELLRRQFVGARDARGHVRLREIRDRRVPPPGQGPRVVALRVGAPRELEVGLLVGRGPVPAATAGGAAERPEDAAREVHRQRIRP